jgi:hypothetical protein
MGAVEVRTEADHQVEAAFAQVIGGDVGFQLLHVDDHRQVGEVEVLQQARQDQLFEVFRRADIEGHGLLRRVKNLATGVAQVDAFQNLLNMAVHGAGLVRRTHTGPRVDKQLILETGAQFLQAVAHGGLADEQRF